MIDPSLLLDTAVALHGHLCPGMALGLRLGAAAMNSLGVARDTDTELLTMLELGDDHCTHCLADGVQVITGCTLGKGNLLKLGHGKFGVTLVERATKRAVRVSPRPEMQEAMRKSPFFTDYRLKNVPFSQVPTHVVEPLIRNVLQAPEASLLQVGAEQRLEISKRAPSLATFRCEVCGEGVAERYGRLSGAVASASRARSRWHTHRASSGRDRARPRSATACSSSARRCQGRSSTSPRCVWPTSSYTGGRRDTGSLRAFTCKPPGRVTASPSPRRTRPLRTALRRRRPSRARRARELSLSRTPAPVFCVASVLMLRQQGAK